MICYRCGEPVKLNDDAGLLDAIALCAPVMAMSEPCHIRCHPSAAQYIMAPEFGEPVVDDRPEYDKRLRPDTREMYEQAFTAAWLQMQEEYK